MCNYYFALFSFVPPSFSASGEVITSHGAIEPDKDNIRLEPYSLPQGFTWDTLDLSNAEVVSRAACNSLNRSKECFVIFVEKNDIFSQT